MYMYMSPPPTFHLARDDLDTVLGQVEGEVLSDPELKVIDDLPLLSLAGHPHAGRAQHIQRGLPVLVRGNVVECKGQEGLERGVAASRTVQELCNAWAN